MSSLLNKNANSLVFSFLNRKLLHVPVKDVNSPYYYPTAPLASITESGSISSEALTDDTLSMTTE